MMALIMEVSRNAMLADMGPQRYLAGLGRRTGTSYLFQFCRLICGTVSLGKIC